MLRRKWAGVDKKREYIGRGVKDQGGYGYAVSRD
jgi:hypothetical protein